MTTADRSWCYWMSNKEWYRINLKKDCYELTDKAPKEAHISFKIWLEGAKKKKKVS